MKECFMCHKKYEPVLEPVSFTSSYGDGIIQVCQECYGVLFD